MSLTTRALRLVLKNPLIASASPLAGEIDDLRRLEDAGVAAIVRPSLFQEQIEAERDTKASRVKTSPDTSPEVLSYFPPAANSPYDLYPDTLYRSGPAQQGIIDQYVVSPDNQQSDRKTENSNDKSERVRLEKFGSE